MQALAFYFFAALTLCPAVAVILVRNPVYSIFNLILAFFGAAGLFVLLGAEFLGMLLIVVYVGAVAVLFLFVVMMLDLPRPRALERTWFFADLKTLMHSAARLFLYLILFIAFYVLFAFVTLKLFERIGSIGATHASLLWYKTVFFVSPFPAPEFISDNSLVFSKTTLLVSAVSMIVSLLIARLGAQWLLKEKFISLARRFVRTVPIAWSVAAVLLVEIILVASVWQTSALVDQVGAPIPPVDKISNIHALGMRLYTDYVYAFQTAGLILVVAMIGAIVLSMRHRSDVRRQNIAEQVSRTRSESVELKDVNVGEGVEC